MEKKFRAKVPADIVLQVTSGNELLKYLLAELKGKNRNNVKSLLTNKQVYVNGVVVTRYNHLLKPGDKVRINKQRSNTENIIT